MSNIFYALAYFLVAIKLIGFLCLEAGFVRGKNRVNVSVKHMIKITLSITFLSTIGALILFREAASSGFVNPYELFKNDDYFRYFFRHCICGSCFIAAMSGSSAERVTTNTFLAISILLASIVYPVLAQWTAVDPLGEWEGWLASLGFYDFADITVVHGAAGAAALASTLIIGPRLGRFGDKKRNVHSNDPTFSSLGVSFIWIGWCGYIFVVAPEKGMMQSDLTIRLLLAGSTGGMASAFCDYVLSKKKYHVQPILIGIIGGLCAASAGLDVLALFPFLIISAIGGLLACLSSRFLARYEVDDVTETVSSHLPPALFGGIAVAFFLPGDASVSLAKYSLGQRVWIQGVGVISCISASFLLTTVALLILKMFIKIRVSPEEEKIGLSIAEHDSSSEASLLLTNMRDQLKQAKFTTPVNIGTDSNISQIGKMYNNVLKKLADVSKEERHLRIQLEQSNLKLSIQKDIIRQLNLSSSIEKGLTQVLPKILKTYNYNGIRVFLVEDKKEEELRFLSSAWVYNKSLSINPEYEGDQQSRPWNLKPEALEQMSSSFSNILINSKDLPDLEKYDLKSVLVVPVIVKNKLSGIVEVFSHKDLSHEVFASHLEESLVRSIKERILQDSYNNDLKQALKIAEETNRTQSEFLAMMSHEIRTPMNGVLGTCGLLVNSNLNDRQREFTNAIRNSAESLLFVINDILDFSKYRSETFKLNSVDFNIDEIIEGVIHDTSARMREKKLELTICLHKDIPVVLNGDSVRLRQIILNLVSNAIKFTSEGEVSLNIWEDFRSENEILLCFQISDTGIGIPEKELPTLFESFRQVDSSSTRLYGGTGLGLAICKTLVNLMGGEISASSEEGKGSVFQFSIKLNTAKDKNLLKKREKSELAVKEKIRGKRILLYEKNQVTKEITKNQLQAWGAEIILLDTPLKAHTLLIQDGPFDLIILSYESSSQNGLEIAFKVRELDDYAEIPIMLYSSAMKEELARELGKRESPVTELLEKPATPSKLMLTLSTLDRHTAERGNKALFLQQVGKKRRSFHSNIHFAKRYPSKILLADDHEMNRRLAIAIMNGWGYTPDVVTDGQQALQATYKTKYDLILMDVEMPIMDGLTATRQIRKYTNQNSRALIIALTAAAMPGDKERCIDAGMNDYLTKPLDPDEIFKLILKYRRIWRKKKTPPVAKKITKAESQVVDAEAVRLSSEEAKEPKTLEFDSDLTELSKLIGTDKNQILEFISPFINELEKYKETVKVDFKAGKIDNIRRVFHSLKSNAKVFGSLEFSNFCSGLEQASKQESPEVLAERLDQFFILLTLFKNKLETKAQELKSE